ncbi:hypothetical protein PSN45_001337 [Yamadazyma tenuis]|nr:hypothetical protein PSN45_001337 [Yamadazyma tenuis]
MSGKNIPKNSLYVFSLSQELVESLELVKFDVSEQHNLETAPKALKVQRLRDDDDDDLTKYNQKREAKGLSRLTEDEFDRLLEQGSVESISGSDTDSSSDSEDEDDALYKRLTETKISEAIIDETSNASHLNSKSSSIFFKSSMLSGDKHLGAFKALFSPKEMMDPITSLKTWSDLQDTGKSALFMMGGGHFAGAIISHRRKNIKGNAVNHKLSVEEQKVEIIKSKTFHRYTTRRKQGGSQSANDNAKGNAKSVGSSIRRYMEQALIQEIRDLLKSWESDLNQCKSIFIRANASQGKKTLVGYEGAVIKQGDVRIKSFPFTTKRATTSELKRAWTQLAYLSITDAVKEDKSLKERLLKQQENLIKSTQQKQHTKEQEITESDKQTVDLLGFAKRQKAPMLINFLKKHNLSPNLELTPTSQYVLTPTLLHFAAANGLTHIVQVLLVNLKADPTLKSTSGKVAAELSSNKQTRSIFQLARHKLGDDYCDWDAAKVGDAMTKEQIEKEEQEENEKIRLEKQRQIQEQLDLKTEMELKKPTFSSGGQLGGVSLLSSTSGLNEDQKSRVLREQRARAAEARMKKFEA